MQNVQWSTFSTRVQFFRGMKKYEKEYENVSFLVRSSKQTYLSRQNKQTKKKNEN